MTGIGGHQKTVFDKDEWLTPPEIIKALGYFDMDPCAPIIRPWDTAGSHYTIEDDGLLLPWFYRVWLNPPYGGPNIIRPWMKKMAEHDHGTALIFARTDTDIFHEFVFPVASAIFFFNGRLTFHHVSGEKAKFNGGAPSCLVAYGFDDAEMLKKCNLDGFYINLRLGGWAIHPKQATIEGFM
jgi:DNA N-6-adenine-methyltransferase (Dam)